MQTRTSVSRHMPSPQCSQINASLALRPYPAHVGCSCYCFLRKWIWVLAYRQFPKFLPRDLATAGIIICHNLLRDGNKVQQRQNTKRSAPYPRLLLSIPLYSTRPFLSVPTNSWLASLSVLLSVFHFVHFSGFTASPGPPYKPGEICLSYTSSVSQCDFSGGTLWHGPARYPLNPACHWVIFHNVGAKRLGKLSWCLCFSWA